MNKNKGVKRCIADDFLLNNAKKYKTDNFQTVQNHEKCFQKSNDKDLISSDNPKKANTDDRNSLLNKSMKSEASNDNNISSKNNKACEVIEIFDSSESENKTSFTDSFTSQSTVSLDLFNKSKNDETFIPLQLSLKAKSETQETSDLNSNTEKVNDPSIEIIVNSSDSEDETKVEPEKLKIADEITSSEKSLTVETTEIHKVKLFVKENPVEINTSTSEILSNNNNITHEKSAVVEMHDELITINEDSSDVNTIKENFPNTVISNVDKELLNIESDCILEKVLKSRHLINERFQNVMVQFLQNDCKKIDEEAIKTIETDLGGIMELFSDNEDDEGTSTDSSDDEDVTLTTNSDIENNSSVSKIKLHSVRKLNNSFNLSDISEESSEMFDPKSNSTTKIIKEPQTLTEQNKPSSQSNNVYKTKEISNAVNLNSKNHADKHLQESKSPNQDSKFKIDSQDSVNTINFIPMKYSTPKQNYSRRNLNISFDQSLCSSTHKNDLTSDYTSTICPSTTMFKHDSNVSAEIPVQSTLKIHSAFNYSSTAKEINESFGFDSDSDEMGSIKQILAEMAIDKKTEDGK